jgi:hypothetical protein
MITGNSYEDVKGKRKGLSIFAVDPGETTGFAWTLLSPQEYEGFASGDTETLRAVSGWKGGFLNGDRRLQVGEINCYSDHYSGRVLREIGTAESIVIEAIRCGNMAKRVSKNRVFMSVVVIEDFILRQHSQSRNLLSPVRLAAYIEAFCYQNPVFQCPIVLQTPSDAKTIMSDKRIRSMGLWIPGKPHATDALRHMLLCLRRLV